VCRELQRLVAEHGEAYLNSIITGDESWLHHYDSESKQASSLEITLISDAKEGQSC
jgi:hypothetical protein